MMHQKELLVNLLHVSEVEVPLDNFVEHLGLHLSNPVLKDAFD